MTTIVLKVAEVPFALHVNDWKEATECLPSYAAFHVPNKHCEEMNIKDFAFEMEVNLQEVTISADDKCVCQFLSSDLNNEIFETSQGGYKFKVNTLKEETAAIASCNADFTRFQISTFGGISTRSCGINNIIMMAFAFASAPYGVLLVHASVVFHNEKAYMFLGSSGTGKSTHSRLWMENIPKTDLLNDDNPAVRTFPDGRCIVYGTPWSGKTPCYRNMQFPIGAIVHLQQAPHNAISRLKSINAFSAFFPSCSMIKWNERNRSQVIRSVEEVVQRVPIYSLECLPDAEAAHLCNQTVEGGNA